jgi:hypothetical protein
MVVIYENVCFFIILLIMIELWELDKKVNVYFSLLSKFSVIYYSNHGSYGLIGNRIPWGKAPPIVGSYPRNFPM